MEGNAVEREERKPLKLSSPVSSEALVFQWSDNPKQNCAVEIIETVRVAASLFPELKIALDKNICLDDINIHSYDDVRQLCKRFSKACNTFSQLYNGSKENSEHASSDLLRHICAKAYNRAVDNEKALNKHYEAFSSQTYGETSFERLQMIIDEVHPTEDDVFVDLGSGVGQLVVHMAGGTKVKKAIGIEIAQLPAKFAEILEIEFKRWMKWFGKKFRLFQLEKGDFLDPNYRDLITQEATLIFINNFAFQADLETRIKRELLSELKNGTKIVSTKPYGNLGKEKLNDRDLNDISAIVDIFELKQCPNACSWTSAYVPYYLHIINRAKLEHYFLSLRNPSLRDGCRSATPSSRTSSQRNSRESSVVSYREYSKNGHRTNGEDMGYGPTTRRRWNNYVSELEQKKKKSGIGGTDDENELTVKVSVFSPTHSEGTNDDVLLSNHSADVMMNHVFASPMNSPLSSPNEKPPKKKSRTPKEQKNGPRGRPRKNPLDGAPPKKSQQKSPYQKSVRLSNDAREGIDIMHQMTCERMHLKPSNEYEANFILTDLKSLRKSNNHLMMEDYLCDTMQPSTSNPLQALPHPMKKSPGGFPTNNKQEKAATKMSKYPKLDKFLDELRNLYEGFLDNIHTPEFVQDLANKIHEKIKIETERATMEALDPKSKEQVFLGANILKDQMRNFGIDLERPTRVLEQSKRIVARYKRIQEKCDELESEITALNAETEQLVAAHQREQQKQQERQQQISQREQLFATAAAVQQVGAIFPSVQSLEQLLLQDMANNYAQQIVSNPLSQLGMINAELTAAQNALRTVQMQQAVSSTSSLPQTLNGLDLNNPLMVELFGKILNGSTGQFSANLQPVNTPSAHQAAQQQQIQAASMIQNSNIGAFGTSNMMNAFQLASNNKKSRGRLSRSDSKNKKMTVQTVVKSEDPQKEAEIQNQVKEILAKAKAQEENAPKLPEKDRKSRGAEKKKEKAPSTLSLISGCTTISQSSTDTPNSLITSPISATSGTPLSSNLALIPQVEPLTPPFKKRTSSDAGFSPFEPPSMPPPPLSFTMGTEVPPKFVSCLATQEHISEMNSYPVTTSSRAMVSTQFVSSLAIDQFAVNGGLNVSIPNQSSAFMGAAAGLSPNVLTGKPLTDAHSRSITPVRTPNDLQSAMNGSEKTSFQN